MVLRVDQVRIRMTVIVVSAHVDRMNAMSLSSKVKDVHTLTGSGHFLVSAVNEKYFAVIMEGIAIRCGSRVPGCAGLHHFF